MFDYDNYKQFLEKYGVYNQGAWRREVCAQDKNQNTSTQFGKLIDLVVTVNSLSLNENNFFFKYI